jgi:hypothetical protein
MPVVTYRSGPRLVTIAAEATTQGRWSPLVTIATQAGPHVDDRRGDVLATFPTEMEAVSYGVAWAQRRFPPAAEGHAAQV